MNNLDPNNILEKFGNFPWNEFKKFFIIFLISLISLIVVVFIIGFIFDIFKKDQYIVRKYYYRTLDNSIGSGEEYYYKYWLWQPNKKKYLIATLKNDLSVSRIYSRKALKRRVNKKTIIPFRREVYGNAK